MSEVLTLEATEQDVFVSLEKDFTTQYQEAIQAESVIRTANLAASVAAHRLGVLANRLQPMVSERGETWKDYLKRHGKKLRSVQRAQRIARNMDEDAAAKLTLEKADDEAAVKEAIARGNVADVNEWKAMKTNLAKARKALEMQESEQAETSAKSNKGVEDQFAERAKGLDAGNRISGEKDADALAAATENFAAAAESIKDKASMPGPRTVGGDTSNDAAATFGGGEVDEANDRSLSEEGEVNSKLLDTEQIELLTARLQEIVITRPNELTDAREDPTVQGAVNDLLAACNGDAEITFGVISIWFSNNGL
jgi:hypothetical protein